MTLRRLQHTHIFPIAIADNQLRPRDHRIYAHIYHKPMQSRAEIRQALGFSKEAVRCSVSRLIETQWAEAFIEPGRTRGQLILPSMPPQAEQRLAALLAQRRTSVPFLGEWLMRCLLDRHVNDFFYHDDASPRWLTTAVDAVSLQLDRWYEFANVALEFQGPQHFQVSNRFVRTAAELARRRRYDGEKIRLCALHKVELIELLPEDLEHHRLRAKLQGKLPLLPVREHGPLFRELTGMYKQLEKHMQKYR